MDAETKRQGLEEELQELQAEKEIWEKRLAFRKERVWKVSKRLERITEGRAAEASKPLLAELEAETQALNSVEKEYTTVLKRIKFLEEKVKKERSKVFDFGWEKVETDELKGGGKRLSGSELEALKIIAEAGGDTVFQTVSRRMRIEYDYARLLCMALGRGDYVDIITRGRCRITEKGEKELEKIGSHLKGSVRGEAQNKLRSRV